MADRAPCVNAELCENTAISSISPFCMTCGSWFKVCGFGWDALQFRDGVDECAVCYGDPAREIKFPARGCSHWFCVSCSRTLLFFDETRYHLDPTLFGCPPCPNGCANPSKGRQCYCDEYDAVQEQWSRVHPSQSEAYSHVEGNSIYRGEPVGSARSKRTCPICRSTL